jgi:hypothetical protein
VPLNDSLGLDDDQYFPPILPESRRNHPEESVSSTQLRSLDTPLKHGKLLTKGKIFRCEHHAWRGQTTEKQKESRKNEHRIGDKILE